MILESIVWVGAALVAYAYAGYPLAIGLLARMRPERERKRDRADEASLPSVSLVLVVHNEASRIEAKLESCLASDYPKDRFDILVVSDGSTDGTDDIVRGYADRGVRLLRLPGPRGKATGLNQGVSEVTGEVVVLTDARQALGPKAVKALALDFADPAIGAVSGELVLASAKDAKASGVGAYWAYEKRIRRAESRYDSTVGATGALYAIRRELFTPIDPRLILDDVAIPMGIVLGGRRVVFEPEAQAFDEVSPDSKSELARKVRTLAGNYQLAWLMPELLSPVRNRLWWQFVSHKLARLAAPWALLVVLLGTSALTLTADLSPSWKALYRSAAVGQIGFYLLAAVGAVAPTRAGGAFRVFRLPYAFALLNWASALALFAFLAGSARVDWKTTGAPRSDTDTPIENESTGGI